MEIYYLGLALGEARKSGEDVPVGVVIVRKGEIIAKACNEKEKTGDTTNHAEILAIKRASKKIGDWRLIDCIMYSTLEPCPMCAGAILQARISKLVYGAKDPKWGACGSVVDILRAKLFNHKVEVKYQETRECMNILSEFFEKLRLKLVCKDKARNK